MKKISAFIMSVLIFLTGTFFNSVVLADSDVSVYLDGKEVLFDVAPCIINDRTLVPIRGVLEAAGATVSWDNEARMTVASKGSTVIWVGVDNPAMTVQKSGTIYVAGFDVAPCIINDRTFVAIKNVAEAFDISVNWDGAKRRVILTSNYEASPKPNIIKISGFNQPKKITVGSSFSIYGTVSADGVIDRVNIKITDVNTGKVQINETEYEINEKRYYLGNIDSRIKFGMLSVGSKLMEITAVTKNETRQVFSYNFDVERPKPTDIEDGVSMLWPVPSSGLITTIFWCDNPFCHSNAGRVNGHAAIDIAAPEGSDVIAVSDGTVIETGFGDSENGFSGYGNFILIDHGNGITTQYSHLYESYVSKGDVISAGQIIGGVGSTGNSTGNHLDFNIELNGERCDPLNYIDIHPEARCYEECDKPFFEEIIQKRNIDYLVEE